MIGGNSGVIEFPPAVLHYVISVVQDQNEVYQMQSTQVNILCGRSCPNVFFISFRAYVSPTEKYMTLIK